MNKVFALIDCNNFFASCERVFNPKLKGIPIAVLSNNDGCIIARSEEVKKIGIPMGAPLHKVKDIVEQHSVKLFSANFKLYGDLSNRVMESLREFSPNIEIYSIDEAFLDLSAIKIEKYEDFAQKIKETVEKNVGVPISVGIGSSKTLAKIASKIAKKNSGTAVLVKADEADKVLKNILVEDIWGIGRNYSEFLNKNGIYNAFDLKNADERWVKSKMSVVGQRTVFELRGIACIEIEKNPESKKMIMSSRSFGKDVSSLKELKESVATYVCRASEKLRSQNSVCQYVTVYIRTNKHKTGKQYASSYQVTLNTPTDFNGDLITAAHIALERIFIKGLQYKKSAVLLSGIYPKNSQKINLFEVNYPFEKRDKVNEAFDKINKKLGRDKITFAASGTKKIWKNKSEMRSPDYTSNWDEIPLVKS